MTACACEGPSRPILTEEMILNYGALPPSLKGWRRFRIEYGFECACPEGLIYLPPHVDPDDIEKALNAVQRDAENKENNAQLHFRFGE